MPGAPSSFLLLVVRPGAPNSFLFLLAMASNLIYAASLRPEAACTADHQEAFEEFS